MANDSIIARPTNNVRVIVAEASGCCASEVRAVATARPSPSAGHMQPMPVVRPAVAIDATAMRVLLSMVSPFVAVVAISIAGRGPGMGIRLRSAHECGGRNVNRGQDAEDVGLNHAREQAERRHDDWKDKGRD